MIHTDHKPLLLLPLQDCQSLALSWVTNVSPSKGKSYQRLIRSLTGIESIQDRFETLSIRFGAQYSNCTSDNPLVKMINSYNTNLLPLNESSLIRKQIHYPAGYKKYIRLQSSTTSLNEAMKQRKYLNISKIITKNDRINLIKPSSRHKKSLIDVSLHIKDKFFSFQAIQWRMSSLMFGQLCPVCNKKFYHTHTSRCLQLFNTDDLFTFKTSNDLIKRLRNIIDLINPGYIPKSYRSIRS